MKVLKYGLSWNGETVIRVPAAARVLRVDLQRGEPHAWVALDPDHEGRYPMRICIVGTGRPVPRGFEPFCTFFQYDGELVWHACVMSEIPMEKLTNVH
ncbi:DUF7352 domain-containing protein [Burkholderia anthina]|uniref:DUF7352 domain-containing protein n=1 Tax=Burkholderia anthina TaxID=179879 RepID=UPI003C7A941E